MPCMTNNGLSLLLTTIPIIFEMGVYMFVYRTKVDVEYVRRLVVIPAANIEGRSEHFVVSDSAVSFGRPLLRVDFRFEKKNTAIGVLCATKIAPVGGRVWSYRTNV